MSVAKVEQIANNRSTGSILGSVSAPAVSTPLAQIPNALTILRLALIPVFVALLIPADGGYSWPAALVFAAAGITDQIDGWLARRWHVESQFGKVADPLADRLMIDAAVILLVVVHHRLPWAALVLGVLILGVMAWRLVRQLDKRG